MSKVNRKGRSKGSPGRFVRLGHELILSDAYMSLTPNARSLLIVLISRCTDKNNGAFWLSEGDAADLMGVSSTKTASAALRELSDAGFIRMTKDAYFNVKTGDRRARRWRLTWLFNDLERKPASNEWRDFSPVIGSPAAKRAQRGQKAVARFKKELSQNQNAGANFTAMDRTSETMAVNITPMNLRADEFPPFASETMAVNSALHIAIPEGEGEGRTVYDSLPHGIRAMMLGLDPTLASCGLSQGPKQLAA